MTSSRDARAPGAPSGLRARPRDDAGVLEARRVGRLRDVLVLAAGHQQSDPADRRAPDRDDHLARRPHGRIGRRHRLQGIVAEIDDHHLVARRQRVVHRGRWITRRFSNTRARRAWMTPPSTMLRASCSVLVPSPCSRPHCATCAMPSISFRQIHRCSHQIKRFTSRGSARSARARPHCLERPLTRRSDMALRT